MATVQHVIQIGPDPQGNLFVSGLPPNTDLAALQELFTASGFNVVHAKMVADCFPGSSAAFVRLGSAEESSIAIKMLHGRSVEVSIDGSGDSGAGGVAQQAVAAVPSPPPPAGSTTTSSIIRVMYAGRDQIPSDNLILQGLPSITDEGLAELFQGAGFQVLQVKCSPNQGSGTGSAMVRIASQEQAEQAIAMLNGRELEVTHNPSAAPNTGGGGQVVPAANGMEAPGVWGSGKGCEDAMASKPKVQTKVRAPAASKL